MDQREAVLQVSEGKGIFPLSVSISFQCFALLFRSDTGMSTEDQEEKGKSPARKVRLFLVLITWSMGGSPPETGKWDCRRE